MGYVSETDSRPVQGNQEGKDVLWREMMNEIIKNNERVLRDEFTLEGYMLALCNYGKPRLTSQGNGQWYCVVDMFVQGSGVEFKVASSFEETSMLNAAKVCYERLRKALDDLGLKEEK